MTSTTNIGNIPYVTITGAGGGAGGTGAVLTTTNGKIGGYTWDNTMITTSYPSFTSDTLTIDGNASITRDVFIKGKSLSERLDKIEERLAILHPNIELEGKWEDLKELRKAYDALEKEIMEKESIWKTLKR